MTARLIGLDVGGETTRLVEGRLKGKVFEIRCARAFPSGELGAVLAEQGLKGVPAMVGVTGRDMILRTTYVPPVPDWQLRELMSYEVEDIAEQSGDKLVADFERLGGDARGADEDLVLLALVRESLVAERNAELGACGAKVAAFTPNAVALHNAVVATDGGEGTLLAASMRGRNTDVALIQDGELVFARNLTGGGDTFTEAVADVFSVPFAKAEQAKRKLGRLPAPGERLSGQASSVARGLESALRQVVGMLQSTLGLCRNQLKVPEFELDRVLLCGPGARIEGLDQALTRTLGLPVERFDPTEGYVVDPQADPGEAGPDFAVAAGLAMMGLLDDAYRVEILSEAAAKARHFREKTLWLVLAGVALVAYLGLYGWISHDNEQSARGDSALLRREVDSRMAARRSWESASTGAAALSEALTRVEQVTAPGSGLITVLDLMDSELPPELWLTEVRTERAVEPGFDWEGLPRPFVVVQGSGKEQDRDLTQVLQELTTRLRSLPQVGGVVMTFDPADVRRGFRFELRLDMSPRPVHESSEPADEPEGAA